MNTKLKRLPLVRHVRYLYWRKKVWDAAASWESSRLKLGLQQRLFALKGAPTEGELLFLSHIWNGRA